MIKNETLLIIFLILRQNISKQLNPTLRFNDDAEFTILYITDLHIGDSKDNDTNSLNVLKSLIKNSNPDLVVLGGDIVSGYHWNRMEKQFFYKNWKKFTDIFLKEKIFYAYAFGNHDIEADLNAEEIQKLEESHPYSLFKGDMTLDPKSVSNFYLKIFSSFENRKDEITSLMWIFDSKRHGCLNKRFSYACITSPQISWYENESKKFYKKYDKIINGLSFFHIPLPEFKDLWNKYETYGHKNEYVYCPKKNTGLFQTMVKMSNIKGIYVGHDHANDFGGFIEGIELAYNRKSGYGSYGYLKRGGRVFKLKEFIDENGNTDFNFNQYILEEDGNIVQNGEMIKQKRMYQRFCKRFPLNFLHKFVALFS